jgi:hypothetical protein
MAGTLCRHIGVLSIRDEAYPDRHGNRTKTAGAHRERGGRPRKETPPGAG